MQIKKRDGRYVDFQKEKIENAIKRAFIETENEIDNESLEKISKRIERKIKKLEDITVEDIQDMVEVELQKEKYFPEAKAYILYRARHSNDRDLIEKFDKILDNQDLLKIISIINYDFDNDRYPLVHLYDRYDSFSKPNMNQEDKISSLIRASSELTSKNAPDWEFISARFLMYDLNEKIKKTEEKLAIKDFKSKIKYLTKVGIYYKPILDTYTDEQIDELEDYMDLRRNNLLNYSGLDLLIKRYLIRTLDNEFIETIQEMFMGIAMHLGIPEKDENRMDFVKNLYDILSSLKATMATPTMKNARTSFNQLSSCNISPVSDDLENILRNAELFGINSKYGAGQGLYMGKVRKEGAPVRGVYGASGGIIPWLRIYQSICTAANQLGVRAGALAAYENIWSKDILDLISSRQNNGDDRRKLHDIFPAICFPDYFWQQARDNIGGTWYLVDDYEVEKYYGTPLDELFGKEWTDLYLKVIEDDRIHKKTISIKDIIRMLVSSWVETGTPFVFNRDTVNKMNPNKHAGKIYSSNLCTEISQNMSPFEKVSEELVDEDGKTYIVEKTIPGDYVICNLASLTLGKIDTNDKEEMEFVISTIMRALDNVIDTTYYQHKYIEYTNKKYRAIGLGTSDYHHSLVKNGIRWNDREKHLEFADKLYEDIAYYAIKADVELAKEKGRYSLFEGSDWQTGEYFELRDYDSDRWRELKEEVAKNGMRNGYIMAPAPNASTSVISNSSAGTDPIMNKYYLEEKKGSIVPRVAPGLTDETFWLYQSAHDVDQTITIEAAGKRQRHIDQSQSVNLYIDSNYSMRQILDLYIKAWEVGMKTVYYVRSKSLEIEECENCAN